MDQGSFEKCVRDKFEGVEPSISNGVWENIEGELNSDLVVKYQSSHGRYQWLTAAAIVIAISSFAIHSLDFTSVKKSNDRDYNALLSDDFRIGSDASSDINSTSLVFNWKPIIVRDRAIQGSEKTNDVGNISIEPNRTATLDLKSKRPTVQFANSEEIVNVYHSVLGRVNNREKSERKFWAGVEAGAGKFSPNFSGGNSISNSVNSSSVASALGANDFVNPTTNATQNSMNEGITSSVGFDFGLKLGKKWTLESGLAYTNINNGSTASIDVLNNFTVQDGTKVGSSAPVSKEVQAISRERSIDETSSIQSEIDLNNNIQFASMPIKAGYYLMDSKFSLRLNAGFSANYLIDNNLSDASNQIINSSQSGLYNDWSFDGIGGIEFGYRLFNKVDLTIEPNYRHSITPLSNSIQNPSQFVVQTGFRYTLR